MADTENNLFMVNCGQLAGGAPPFWWVQPSVVALGLAISLGVAISTIRANRRTARIKATLDIIEASESKDHYLNLYENYKKYRDVTDFRTTVLSPTTDDHKRFRRSCFDFLNHYELIAIGVREGILDERFYKRWMGYAVLRDYGCASDLILSARSPVRGDTGDISAYIELERLCVKWGAHPIAKRSFKP